MTCDCCYGEFKGRKGFGLRNGNWLCSTCREYEDRWDSMTSEERREELESMMLYSAEVDRA